MPIENFVETLCYSGGVYRTSGWIHVSTTHGRTRNNRDKLYGTCRGKTSRSSLSEGIGREY